MFFLVALIGCDSVPTHGVVEKDNGRRIDDAVVEAGCGQCVLGQPGNGCDLAIRFEGAVYFVDGTSIDDHGDAHAEDGFCQAIRQARVSGRIENGRFHAESFELLNLGEIETHTPEKGRDDRG
jgi:hypothetical protein